MWCYVYIRAIHTVISCIYIHELPFCGGYPSISWVKLVTLKAPSYWCLSSFESPRSVEPFFRKDKHVSLWPLRKVKGYPLCSTQLPQSLEGVEVFAFISSNSCNNFKTFPTKKDVQDQPSAIICWTKVFLGWKQKNWRKEPFDSNNSTCILYIAIYIYM